MLTAWPLSKSAYTGFRQYKILLYALLLGIGDGAVGVINTHIIGFPLFMDTIGTLISTAAFGFWPGIVSAVTTHSFTELLRGLTGADFTLPWIICSSASVITLAVLIRYKLFENFFHAVLATILITLVNSISGAFVATFFYSGITIHPVDYITTAFLSVGHSFFTSAFWARIPINMIDKGIAVFITFGLFYYLRTKRREKEEF
ncbi:MAG: hypothetical protein K9M94_12145 [Spirochaetia bacterium]|nr:hypothetical protein [Spirochaetia bacterium]